MQLPEHIHGGNLARASLRYGLPAAEFIDFSANINPLGPSPQVVKAIVRSLSLIASYPDPDCTELRTALAAYLGVEQRALLMGNGAAELIYLLIRVTGCRRALIPTPTFSEYGLAVLSHGGEIIELPMDEKENFRLPVEKIVAGLPRADIVFICNPNNPTGRLVNAAALRAILNEARRHGVLVVVDEAFMDFIPGRELFSVMSEAGTRGNLAVLYSLTKFFGIPGLRLGAIATSPDLIARMGAAKDPWNVNILAQVAGLEGLRDLSYMEETNRLVRQERKFLLEKIAGIPGLQPLPGAANFLLVRVAGSGLTSGDLTDLLGRRGVLVRDCRGFSGLEGRYIRIAVKTRPENQKLLRSLSEIMGGADA